TGARAVSSAMWMSPRAVVRMTVVVAGAGAGAAAAGASVASAGSAAASAGTPASPAAVAPGGTALAGAAGSACCATTDIAITLASSSDSPLLIRVMQFMGVDRMIVPLRLPTGGLFMKYLLATGLLVL